MCASREKWIKKKWYIYTMEYYSAIKKEQNNVICSDMDGPRGYHTNWSDVFWGETRIKWARDPCKYMEKHHVARTESSQRQWTRLFCQEASRTEIRWNPLGGISRLPRSKGIDYNCAIIVEMIIIILRL